MIKRPDPGREALPEENRRRWRRHAVAERITAILTAHGRNCACDIEDISLAGARLRLRDAVPENLEVRLEHPLIGYIYGRRVWAASDAIGVELDLSARSLRLLAHHLGAAPVPDTAAMGARDRPPVRPAGLTPHR